MCWYFRNVKLLLWCGVVEYIWQYNISWSSDFMEGNDRYGKKGWNERKKRKKRWPAHAPYVYNCSLLQLRTGLLAKHQHSFRNLDCSQKCVASSYSILSVPRWQRRSPVLMVSGTPRNPPKPWIHPRSGGMHYILMALGSLNNSKSVTMLTILRKHPAHTGMPAFRKQSAENQSTATVEQFWAFMILSHIFSLLVSPVFDTL